MSKQIEKKERGSIKLSKQRLLRNKRKSQARLDLEKELEESSMDYDDVSDFENDQDRTMDNENTNDQNGANHTIELSSLK
jgi:hypothetical protein